MKTKVRKQETISIKDKYNLDNSYSLVYVDYRDSIEDFKILEQMVQDGNTQALYENNDTWISDNQFDSASEVIKELKANHPDMSDEDEEDIQSYIYDHDDSTPEADLMRNTPSEYFYYSLGLDDNGMELEGGDPDKIRIDAIIKRLGIDDAAMRKVAEDVILESGYGGQWVILFEDHIEDMLDDGNVIEFGPKVELCLMNRGNGSGYSVALGRTLTFKFDRSNLHCDRGAPGYNFTNEVCGMTKGFMDGATIKTLPKNALKSTIPSLKSIKEERGLKREAELEEKWNKTKVCTPGDMKWDRHPKDKQEYINNYPCGNKCHACGTFWID